MAEQDASPHPLALQLAGGSACGCDTHPNLPKGQSHLWGGATKGEVAPPWDPVRAPVWADGLMESGGDPLQTRTAGEGMRPPTPSPGLEGGWGTPRGGARSHQPETAPSPGLWTPDPAGLRGPGCGHPPLREGRGDADKGGQLPGQALTGGHGKESSHSDGQPPRSPITCGHHRYVTSEIPARNPGARGNLNQEGFRFGRRATGRVPCVTRQPGGHAHWSSAVNPDSVRTGRDRSAQHSGPGRAHYQASRARVCLRRGSASRCRRGAANWRAHFADEETEGAEPCQARVHVPMEGPGEPAAGQLRAGLGLMIPNTHPALGSSPSDGGDPHPDRRPCTQPRVHPRAPTTNVGVKATSRQGDPATLISGRGNVKDFSSPAALESVGPDGGPSRPECDAQDCAAALFRSEGPVSPPGHRRPRGRGHPPRSCRLGGDASERSAVRRRPPGATAELSTG